VASSCVGSGVFIDTSFDALVWTIARKLEGKIVENQGAGCKERAAESRFGQQVDRPRDARRSLASTR